MYVASIEHSDVQAVQVLNQHVRLKTWWFEFDPRLRQLFFQAYFHLSPLQKHVRKVVSSFGMKSCVSTGVRKSGNTYASPTAMI